MLRNASGSVCSTAVLWADASAQPVWCHLLSLGSRRQRAARAVRSAALMLPTEHCFRLHVVFFSLTVSNSCVFVSDVIIWGTVSSLFYD